jgi:hypothetical protein
MEAICIHDVIEEVGERGAEPAIKISDEERIFIWAALSKIGKYRRGSMSTHSSPPHVCIPFNQISLVVDRLDDEMLLPCLHQGLRVHDDGLVLARLGAMAALEVRIVEERECGAVNEYIMLCFGGANKKTIATVRLETREVNE